MSTDETGKVSFDHIYSRTDPRPFFRTLRAFEYGIPGLAAPQFARLIAEYRTAHGDVIKNLRESKFEHYFLGNERIYRQDKVVVKAIEALRRP